MNQRKSHRLNFKSGFTLPEIVGVFVLIGILSAIGFQFFRTSDADLPAELARVKSHLRFAQTRAQADIHPWRVVFIDNKTYEIGPVITPGPGYVPAIIPSTGSTRATLADGIRTSAGTVVRFDSWGRPMTDTDELLTSNLRITLRQGSERLSLKILPQTGLVQ